MRFSKMHGAGNDYVYIDCFEEDIPADPAALARQVSRRHFGVGSDGLVLILPADSADAQMRMFNADGSEAEMCGNALRCVAWYLRDRKRCDQDQISVVTGRGVLTATVTHSTPCGGRVRVDMGQPLLDAASIPTSLPRAEGTLRVGSAEYEVTCVSMGNPHCVLFCPSIEEAPVETLGPQLEQHASFPARTNVEFAEVVSRTELKVRVWERGSGETLACGTGACAAVVAAVTRGLCERSVTVRLRGGTLEIAWPVDGPVEMTGPVTEVYRGDLRSVPEDDTDPS